MIWNDWTWMQWVPVTVASAAVAGTLVAALVAHLRATADRHPTAPTLVAARRNHHDPQQRRAA